MGVIRLMLAVAVLLSHCPPGVLTRFLHPALAVQCFYAISGFLIQMVILTRYAGEKSWRRRFLASRLLRIYPVYFVFLILALLLLGCGKLPFLLQRGDWLAVALWLENNMLILGQDVCKFIYFDFGTDSFRPVPVTDEARQVLGPDYLLAILPQCWTLSLELWFYLCAPFLLLRRTRVLAAWILGCFILRVMIAYGVAYRKELLYEFFPTELPIFLLGALSYRAYAYAFASGRLENWLTQRGHANAKRTVLHFCAALVVLLSVLYRVVHVGFWGHFYAPPLGAPGGYWLMLALTILLLPFAFHFSRHHKWDRFVGELSYPLYVCHWTVLGWISAHTEAADKPYICIEVLGLSLLLSIAALLLVDRPMERMRHRRFYRRAVFREDAAAAPAPDLALSHPRRSE